MNNIFTTCKRCLNPWVIGIIVVVIIGLIIFFPILGIAGLIAALPIIGCTVMCGAMALMMGKGNKKNDS